jgi:AraC-binding-like domain
LLSEQRITRRERHIAKLDKDCYYVEFVQQGKVNILQAGQTLLSNAGVGAIFSASEAYDLECVGRVRSLYLEIPRKEFSSRFNENRIPVAADCRRILLDACIGGIPLGRDCQNPAG